MSDELERGRTIFFEEARELLDELETALLGLEDDPDDPELVGRVFRAMHTLKGSGGMFGFDDVSSFTHEVETCFDMVRSGRLRATRELMDVTLGSLDQVRLMLDGHAGGPGADREMTEEFLRAFRDITSSAPSADTVAAARPSIPAPQAPAGPCPTDDEATYEIRFRPSGGIMRNGTNPLNLIMELRAMGGCDVVAHTDQIPALDELDPETCYTWWDITLTTSKKMDEIRDVFIFVEDESDISVERVDRAGADGPWDRPWGQGRDAGGPGRESAVGRSSRPSPRGNALIGQILVEKGEVSPDAVEEALRQKKRMGEILVEMGKVSPEARDAALTEQRARQQSLAERDVAANIRVASDRLDVLADLVGELVTAQARLSRLSAEVGNAELTGIAEEVEKLAEMLRDNTLGMRMVPFGTTFTKFKRLVRDLSGGLGKDAALETSGGETEMDKTVIERLNDPIMHLIRNCLDHGIETPVERAKSGKPRRGTVRLSATHSGGNVYVTIADDGRGMDPDAIRRAAVERGLVSPDARPADGDLFMLAMSPGFSTARAVSDVSGRGVGLDVVKRRMDSLRGAVDIESKAGHGTVITLKLPLTLAIIDGLLVGVAGSFYVVPLGSVRECVERVGKGSSSRRFVDVRGEIIPTVALREVFGIGGKPPDIEHVVVVEDGGQKAALTVDRVVGGHQTVIKPLGRAFRDAEGVSGATVLGDGTLALILDLPRLFACAMRDEAGRIKAA